MSAIEALAPAERREAERLRPASAIRVAIGRGDGAVIDISKGGMRVRHTIAATRGSHVRVTFDWQQERFDGVAEVLASRVVSLGDSIVRQTMFESRLRFVRVTPESKDVLERVLAAITNRELRRWIANLRGWTDELHHDATRDSGGSFIRCRLVGRHWQKKWTHDPTQPASGFLLPANISAAELANLCETYIAADADGRHLIRLMAEEAVKGV